MHQREQVILHGNAIRFGEQCVVFAGNSGNGKSTLATAFYQRGYEILSDDLAVIDADFNVQPSYPQLKIWQDVADKLNIDTSKLTRIRYQVNKYAYPLKKGFCETPLPVSAVYILHTHNKDEIEFESVLGFEKFNPLKNHTYRSKVLNGLNLKKQHLANCSQLADRIRLVHITRPRSGFKIDELVEYVEKDLRDAGIL
jgi:hypothetical protein